MDRRIVRLNSTWNVPFIADRLNQPDIFGVGTAFVCLFSLFKKSSLTFYTISWFQSVVLANRACGGGLVAWAGTSMTNAPGSQSGAYIADSSIIRVSFIIVDHT